MSDTYDCGGPDHCWDDICAASDRGSCGRWSAAALGLDLVLDDDDYGDEDAR